MRLDETSADTLGCFEVATDYMWKSIAEAVLREHFVFTLRLLTCRQNEQLSRESETMLRVGSSPQNLRLSCCFSMLSQFVVFYRALAVSEWRFHQFAK